MDYLYPIVNYFTVGYHKNNNISSILANIRHQKPSLCRGNSIPTPMLLVHDVDKSTS